MGSERARGCYGLLGLQLAGEPSSKDVKVVKAPPLVALGPAEDDHLDPYVATDAAIAALPGRGFEDLPI